MNQQAESRAMPPEPSSVRLVLSLAIAGLLSGLIIVTAFEATLPTITAYKAEELRRAVFKVLPGIDTMERLVLPADGAADAPGTADDAEAVYAGFDAAGRLVGYAIPGEGPGFQDTIRLLYGYQPDQRQVVGMEILESRETPGLGDKIYKDGDFVAGFRSLSIDPEIVAVKKGRRSASNQIDAITGATISSKAVVRIINEANDRWLPRLDAQAPKQRAAAGASGQR